MAEADSSASEVDETTQQFMEQTIARVNKMRANTTQSTDKTQALRAGLSEAEQEAAKQMMKEVAAAPAEKPLSESELIQAQFKIRNNK